MNYLRELNAFRDWSILNSPSTGQVALWYSLMSVNNAAGWVDWFTAANQTLQLMTGLSRQGLDKARNQLAQRGLIEYRKGTSNQAGKYRMVSFECKKVGTEVVTQVVTEVVTPAAFEESQKGRVGSTLLDLDINKTKTSGSGDMRVRKVAEAYQQIFITGMNELQKADMLEYLDKGMEPDLMIEDMKTAKRNNSGFAYAFKIIRRHFDQGILTLEQYRSLDEQGGGDHARDSGSSRTATQQKQSDKVRSITGGRVGKLP